MPWQYVRLEDFILGDDGDTWVMTERTSRHVTVASGEQKFIFTPGDDQIVSWRQGQLSLALDILEDAFGPLEVM